MDNFVLSSALNPHGVEIKTSLLRYNPLDVRGSEGVSSVFVDYFPCHKQNISSNRWVRACARSCVPLDTLHEHGCRACTLRAHHKKRGERKTRQKYPRMLRIFFRLARCPVTLLIGMIVFFSALKLSPKCPAQVPDASLSGSSASLCSSLSLSLPRVDPCRRGATAP